MIKNIPNIFTLFNLFLGCCAIVFTLQSNEMMIRIENNQNIVVYLPEKIWLASIFICLAAVVDFFDGFIARFFKATSELGKQLDSLSDVVSFGVAPSVILYQLLRLAFATKYNSLGYNWFVLSPAFLVACFAGYRLAKFNLDTRQTKYFIGMPTPIIGIVISILPIMVWTNTNNKFNLNSIIISVWFLYGLILLICYLMVCKIKFISLKLSSKMSKNILPMSTVFLFIASLIFFKWVGIIFAWLGYIFLSAMFQKHISEQ